MAAWGDVESAKCVHQIDEKLNTRENELRAEREDVENKFKKERTVFDETLDSYNNLVNKFKDAGGK